MHTLRLLWAAHNEEIWIRRYKRNISRQCLENISEMPESLFIERFRLDKRTFNKLCENLSAHTMLRGTKQIPLEVKVLCTLNFLATGSYQRIIGVTQHLPQRTTSRCIRQVIEALNSDFMSSYVEFPQTQQERSRIRQEFQRRFHLPGVIGCIDCTHIAIVKPDKDEHLYFNRKGYHSINVQMICDHDLKILNVNTKFGGATHDSFIWASSRVEPYMRELHQRGEQTWLLGLVREREGANSICHVCGQSPTKTVGGDSGYPQRAWLMTPVLHAAPQSLEEVYTARHIQARNCIERCFGLLKARWRCLLKHRTLHYHPNVARRIISACCVLHNIALQARLPPPVDLAEQHDDGNDVVPVRSSAPNSQELVHGRAMLTSLINRL